MNKTIKAIIGKIICPDEIIDGGVVYIKDGKILSVQRKLEKEYLDNIEILDFSKNIISPGYIDLHTHGGHGYDVMDNTEESIMKIASMQMEHGVTSFLATTVSASEKDILKCISNIKEVMRSNYVTNILGIHLEGPFINNLKKGAHNPDYIINPNVKIISNILSGNSNIIRIVTLAPELKGAKEIIKILKQKDIIISVGHSNLTFEGLMEIIDLGVTHITHIFNGMNELHHRNPGIPCGALLSDKLKVEVIADGIHIHPAVIKLIVKLKGVGNVILVSDSNCATEMGDGIYEINKLKIQVAEGVARLEDGSLAGSTITVDKAVKNIIKWGVASIPDAIKMATINPAKAIRIDNYKGLIAEGKDADIIILDNEFNVIVTIIKGVIVYRSS